MRDFSKLRGRIAEKGYNITTFAEVVNISRNSLGQKIAGLSDFKAGEIESICNMLDIPGNEIGKYFFADRIATVETRA